MSGLMNIMEHIDVQEFSPIFMSVVRDCIASFRWRERRPRGSPIVFGAEELLDGFCRSPDLSGCEVYELRGRGTRRSVAAVDASVTAIGLWDGGVLASLKGAVVQRSHEGVRVTVLGPVPKYVPLEVTDDPVGDSVLLSELRWFERHLQAFAASQEGPELLLFDSPLAKVDRGVLELSRSRHVVGVVKSSPLALIPGALELPPTRGVGAVALVREGEFAVTVSRLSPNGLPLRIDVWPADGWREALEDVLTSDCLVHGYPESLALAHAYSRQTWPEVFALRSLLTRELRAGCIEAPDVRSTVLSPFDGR
ncbi:MAG: hypothetical protein NZ953_03920 [Thaumarchaeota archaeon]|nr:hypothetical protein [Candidatus Calditenuaceae archaeon]